MKLAGKVILLVSGMNDLAATIGLRLIEDGAAVVFAGADSDRGQAFVEQAEALGGQVAFSSTNPESEVDAQSMVAEAVMTFGSIDGMIAFSGSTSQGAANKIESDEWQLEVDDHLKSTWLAAKYTLPFLRKSDLGSIVFVMSNQNPGCSQKRALAALTQSALGGLCQSLAVDYGPAGIRVNSVMVGPIETTVFTDQIEAHEDPTAARAQIVDQVPLGRVGKTKEVAPAVSFLLSSQAAFISGSVLHIDGGAHASASPFRF